MTFAEIRGQEEAISLLKKINESRRIASSYLFVGPPGTGRKTSALAFSAALNCMEGGKNGCGVCSSCTQIMKENHPDVRIWRIEEGRRMVTIDRVRQIEASLMLKPYGGGYKVAILDEAETMNWDAANAFLLTLEEPPPKTVLILVATNIQLLPDTIVSRCQRIYFRPLPDKITRELLMSGEEIGEEEARISAALAEGSFVAAKEYCDETWQKSFRDGMEMMEILASGDEGALFVKAGTISTGRDDIARMVAILEKIVRLSLREKLGLTEVGMKDTQFATSRSIISGSLDEAGFIRALETFQEAKKMLKGNVNARLVLEGLLIDLGFIMRTGSALVPRYGEQRARAGR